MTLEPTSAFAALVDQVPPYDAYLPARHLLGEAAGLAAQFPETCHSRTLGHSRQGTPIDCLTISEGGPFHALLVGLPHPDEPIGALMLSFLARRLASDPELLRSLQYTWHVVFVADPDGSRLNEGWYGGPFTPEFMGRRYYRPIEADQFEWSFPIDYKTLHFERPNPECEAVMRLVAETPLDYLANLHNCTVGGAYLYLSHPAATLHAPFYRMLERNGIPPHRGEPEVPYLVSMDGDAVFRSYGTRDVYDFYESTGHPDPRQFINAGTCLDEYVVEKWDTFTLVCELPYFAHPDLASRERGGRTRLALLQEAWQAEADEARWIQDVVQEVHEHLSGSPFARVLQNYRATYAAHREAELHHARGSSQHARPASVAEEIDVRLMRGYDHLFVLGQLLRMLEWEQGIRPDGWIALPPRRPPHDWADHVARVRERFERCAQRLQAAGVVVAPSLQALVRCMLEMCLRGATHARDQHRRGRPRGAHHLQAAPAWPREGGKRP